MRGAVVVRERGSLDQIWRCPRCRGELRAAHEALVCSSCRSDYQTVNGIPDLRIDAPSWIDCDEDREQARQIVSRMGNASLEEVIRHVFRHVRDRSDENVDYRTLRVLGAPARLRHEITGWLDDATRSRTFLDLGCGPGMLLAAAAAEGRAGIGVDVSMVWLVVAQRLIESFGGVPILAAGFAESLPLRDESVGAVVSLDVIEHVGDQATYLRELDRVTETHGLVALATPNRYSVASEPHVGVWGVGWLPRPWQQRYAERRSGMSYAYTRLLSTPEARRLFDRHTSFDVRLIAPGIPDEEIVLATPRRKALGRIYNAFVGQWAGQMFALRIGAFFRVVGRKRARTEEMVRR